MEAAVFSDIRTDTNSFGIIYNDCYGGFEYSVPLLEAYNEIAKSKLEFPCFVCRRTDQLMVKLVEAFGELASGSHSNLRIKYIPIEYCDCIHIDEYDGMESLSIDWYKYALIKIKNVVCSSDNDEQKQKTIIALINQYLK